jgi:biopolymer transport protein ExbD
MKFRAQQRSSSMPEMNLVPLMDVIMVILTFFIILSMTLTNFRSIDIRLPQGQGKDLPQSSRNDRLMVGLNNQGQVLLQGKAIAQRQLEQKVSTYLSQNSAGVVVLQIDRQVPYQKVSQMLEILRKLGGDRVSLAME